MLTLTLKLMRGAQVELEEPMWLHRRGNYKSHCFAGQTTTHSITQAELVPLGLRQTPAQIVPIMPIPTGAMVDLSLSLSMPLSGR